MINFPMANEVIRTDININASFFFQLWRLFKPKTEDGIETAEDWFNFVDINSDGLITKYVPFQMLF